MREGGNSTHFRAGRAYKRLYGNLAGTRHQPCPAEVEKLYKSLYEKLGKTGYESSLKGASK